MRPSLTNHYLFLVFISCILLLLSGCQKDTNTDSELTEILNSISTGKGLEYFILPDGSNISEFPQDPKNPLTPEKIQLGKLLYHETGLGRNPKMQANFMTYSCASCHHVDAEFQAGIAQGLGECAEGFGVAGEKRKPMSGVPDSLVDCQSIRSPTVLNVAYQELMLWNGQFGAVGKNIGTEMLWLAGTPKEKNKLGFHGVETQAIAGIDVHRLKIDKDFLSQYKIYKDLFNAAFPDVPESDRMNVINAGMAIAAYERSIVSNQAPFQRWLRGDQDAMTEMEKQGAVLFFTKGECYKCHTGPALNSMEFYALGMNDLLNGVYGTINSPGSKSEHKGRGGFTGKEEDMYKFKVPQLYNLKGVRFLGHGSQFHSVKDVLEYKNKAVPSNPNVPVLKLAKEFVPLKLSDEEIEKILVFIEFGLYDPDLKRYVPQTLPTGLCFPNNDPQSRKDKGCQ